jgi:hypothetical protein
MIFTGNKKTEISHRIITVEGFFGAGMSLWAFWHAQSQRLQREAMRGNQVIIMDYELGTVEMDEFFSQIVEE